MKFLAQLILLICFNLMPALASTSCFIIKDLNSDEIVLHEGVSYVQRYAPCSTFKIPLALMGFDSSELTDKQKPSWEYQEGYNAPLDIHKQPCNPEQWMQRSCVWFSQLLTQKLGVDLFQEYVNKLDYGNKDISGDPGQNNGLTRCWLSSSLKISPIEQVEFLKKLIDDRLPVSLMAHTLTKEIMFLQELAHGWRLHGKTGSGSQVKEDGSLNKDLQMGWFVGWVSKGEKTYVFALNLQDGQKEESYAGLRAREIATKRLIESGLLQ